MPDRIDLPAGSILEAAPDGMAVVDGDGIIRLANRAMGQIFGYEASELVGQSIEILVPDEARSAHVEERRRFSEQPVRRPMGSAARLHGRRRDGSVFPVHVSLSPLATPAGEMIIAAVRDMSPWVKAELQIAEANRRRALAEDQERIARDLHDTVIQELFAVGMSLQAVHGEAESPRVAECIARSVDTLDETIRQVRSTIFGLYAANRRTGLRAELDQVVRALVPSLGFEPRLDLRGPIDTLVPAEIAEHVVPTVREALSNVARHARASSAEVEVHVAEGGIRVRVRDDGTGIAEQAGRRSGLANLAQRAEALGGILTVGSDGDRGTLLEWSVPLTGAYS